MTEEILSGRDPGDEQPTSHLVDDKAEFNEAMKHAPADPPPGPETCGPENVDKNLPSPFFTQEHEKIGQRLINRVIDMLSPSSPYDVQLDSYAADNDLWGSKVECLKIKVGDRADIEIKIKESK